MRTSFFRGIAFALPLSLLVWITAFWVEHRRIEHVVGRAVMHESRLLHGKAPPS